VIPPLIPPTLFRTFTPNFHTSNDACSPDTNTSIAIDAATRSVKSAKCGNEVRRGHCFSPVSEVCEGVVVRGGILGGGVVESGEVGGEVMGDGRGEREEGRGKKEGMMGRRK